MGQDAWRKTWSFDFFFFESTQGTLNVVAWYVYIEAKAEVMANIKDIQFQGQE